MNEFTLANISIHISTLVALSIFINGLKRKSKTIEKRMLVFIARFLFVFYFVRLLSYIFDNRFVEILLVSLGAFIPLVLVLMYETIVVRPAPFWLKLYVLIGGVVFIIWDLVDRDFSSRELFLILLMIFQFGAILAILRLVYKDRRVVSSPGGESILKRFGLSIAIVAPLIVVDYGRLTQTEALQLSNLAILLFIWLSFDRSGDRKNLSIKLFATLMLLILSFLLSWTLANIMGVSHAALVPPSMVLFSSAMLLCICYSEINIRVRNWRYGDIKTNPMRPEFQFVYRIDLKNFDLAKHILDEKSFIGFNDLDDIARNNPLAADYLRHLLRIKDAVLIGAIPERPDEILFIRQSSILENTPSLEEWVQLFEIYIENKQGVK